jgi:hypothetical protein
VEWGGYLTQQRRWARSVLDIKFNVYPDLARNLRLGARIMGLLHGLFFLIKPLLCFYSLLILALALATGLFPEDATHFVLTRFALAYAALGLCGVYQQRFYLDPCRECGLHWRATLLQFAKWPYFLMALGEVALGRRLPYVLTPKVRQKTRRRWLLASNLTIMGSISVAWLVGLATGHVACGALLAVAASAILLLTFLIASEAWESPEPFDKSLSPQPGVDSGDLGRVGYVR